MNEEDDRKTETTEDQMQQLRSKATELLLREEWEESVQTYTLFINLCQNRISNLNEPDHLPKLHKSLCLSLCNRAEARSRLRDFEEALKDCDMALQIESTHFKTLFCKGKILLCLSRYSAALDCFKTALLDPQRNVDVETVNGYLERCKKLEFQSRTGCFDLSDWILSGFRGKSPELAEFIGAIEIKRSEISGRGLFAGKNMDAGTIISVTKAVSTERGIVTDTDEESGKNAQMVMWKNFVGKVIQSTSKCERTRKLLNTLSTADEVEEVPDINIFRADRPDDEETTQSIPKLDTDKILAILDMNSLVEHSVSSKILGKNKHYYGVGLWILPSFINHSCNPNARRVHVGDYAILLASRDIKIGEEITFAYFDALTTRGKRNEMSSPWGFLCKCKRCKFENDASWVSQEWEDMGMGNDLGGLVYRLEEGMRRCGVRGKEKGYLRASYWVAYTTVYGCERSMKKWGKRIPTVEVVVDSVADVVGSDERIVKMVVDGLKRSGGNISSVGNMERVMKLGRGVYGKVVKKQALKFLLEIGGS